jgi:glutamate transport system permease protein
VQVIFDNLPVYWGGFLVTLQLTIVGGIFATVIGVIIAVFRISPVASLRGFATVYTEIIRCTPLTLVMFFCAIVLPVLGVDFPYLSFALIALSVYTSPFVAEALRSGINGVAVGQAEAARSLGLGFGQTVGLIVFPQAFRMTIPPLINVFIALTKNTSIAGAFYVAELFGAGRALVNANGNAVIAILLGVAFFYLVITVPLGQIAAHLERKVAVTR